MKDILRLQHYRIVKALETTDYAELFPDKSIRLKQCCQEIKAEMQQCQCGCKSEIYFHRCKLSICPMCSAIKSQGRFNEGMKTLDYYQWKYGGTVLFLTWTLVTSKNLEKQIKKLKKSLRRLKQSNYWNTFIIGGFESIEVKRSNRKWNCHAHMIILSKEYPLDLKKLKKTWLRITGDSHVMKAILINTREDAKDAFKYCLKMDKDMNSGKSIYEFAVIAHKIKFFNKIGSFYNEEEIIKELTKTHYKNVGKAYHDKFGIEIVCPDCFSPAKWNVRESSTIPFEAWEKKSKKEKKIFCRKSSDEIPTHQEKESVYDILLPYETILQKITSRSYGENEIAYFKNPEHKPINLFKKNIRK